MTTSKALVDGKSKFISQCFSFTRDRITTTSTTKHTNWWAKKWTVLVVYNCYMWHMERHSSCVHNLTYRPSSSNWLKDRLMTASWLSSSTSVLSCVHDTHSRQLLTHYTWYLHNMAITILYRFSTMWVHTLDMHMLQGENSNM